MDIEHRDRHDGRRVESTRGGVGVREAIPSSDFGSRGEVDYKERVVAR